MSFNVLYPISAQPIVPLQDSFFELERITQQVSDTDDLEVAFSRIRQEVSVGTQVIFRIVREGQLRGLHPVIWQEAYRIGREALLNAFRHSEASQVELELEYAPTRLRVAVRDNGKGMTPELFRSGQIGHRGLSKMRELAEQMGGKLKLLSRVAAGTEIELSIPAHIAFLSPVKGRRLGWAFV
jgi:signal transduction histidine kinase